MTTADEILELRFYGIDWEENQVGSPHELRVRFEFPWDWPAYEGLVRGFVVANDGALRVEYGFLCFGWDLTNFAEDIRRFHAAYDGKAMFVNAEGSVELTLVVRDRGRGLIAVSVRMERHGASFRTVPPARAWIELDRFEIEQSYLPGMVERIRDFLACTGISTDLHPSKGS